MQPNELTKKEILKKDIFYMLVFVLSGIIVFSLGYFTANLIKIQKPPLVVEKVPDEMYHTEKEDKYQGLPVVASVNGTRYHYEHCPSAGRINEENKIEFSSSEEAEEAGYSLAANCR